MSRLIRHMKEQLQSVKLFRLKRPKKIQIIKEILGCVPYRKSLWRPVWPDFAKFHHFTKTLKNFGHFERVQIVFAKVLSLLWPILNAVGQILIVENGKNIKK